MIRHGTFHRADELENAIYPRLAHWNGCAEVYDRHFSRLRAEGAMHDLQLEFVRKDGTILPVLLFAIAVRDGDGEFRMSCCVLHNMERRKPDELSSLRLAAVLSSCDDAVIAETPERIIAEWNAGAEAIFGYTAREMKGLSMALLTPPERRDEFSEILATVRRGEPLRHL
jgi:PAS domain-containing protein